MSANSDNLKPSDSVQLADFESRLGKSVDDETVLAEIHVAIKELVSKNDGSEVRIREALQKRFESGDLRPESFELVQKMLDRILGENVPTLTVGSGPATGDEAAYAATMVIGEEAPFVATVVIGDEVPDAMPVEKTTPRQIQVGSILRDRFLLQHQVLGGGTGVVYRALDQRLAEAENEHTQVAIKLLPSELSRNENALRALQQEVAKGRCLVHPNIVRFIDLDREDDLYFIVMEWIEGKSLASILDESGSKKIDLATTLDIIKQVSLALEYAHKRGVVHGDVNPGNVRITPAGDVKLFDFGIARILQKEQDAQPDFDPRELGAKSPEYSSMQVLTGENPVPADDVFSLACLMYRLVAGYRVFGPRSAAEAAAEGMEPQQPQGLSDAQWQPLKKSLAYSRVPRFSSPSEFVAALGDLPKLQPALAAPPKQTAPPAPPKPPAQPAPPVQTAPPKPPAQAAPPAQAVQPVQAAPPAQAAAPAQPVQPVQATPPAPPPTPLAPTEQPAPLVVPDEPLAARRFDIEPRRSPWRLAILGIILIASVVAGIKMDVLETIETLIPPEASSAIAGLLGQQTAAPEEDEIVTLQAPAEAAADNAAVDEAVADDAEAGESVANDVAADAVAVNDVDSEALVEGAPLEDIFDEEPPEETVAESSATEAPVEAEVDFAAMLPATLTVGLAANGQVASEVDLTIREGTDATTIDLIRMTNILEPYTVLLEEIGFTGNRSPWEEGRYEIANSGYVTFEAGENRARTIIFVPSDSQRDPDRQITIQVREVDNAGRALARIELKLEDDDQRTYEAGLPPNTIAFAEKQIFIREADPAVQIDVIRFRPTNTAVEISYLVHDVSATAGEDYFAPALKIIYFAPGQRSARILIPLVQDSEPEVDEAFMLELVGDTRRINPDLFQQITVMIRDDD